MSTITSSSLVWVIQAVQLQIHYKNRAGENCVHLQYCPKDLHCCNLLNCRSVAGTCRQPEQHLKLATQGINTVCVTHDQVDPQTEYALHVGCIPTLRFTGLVSCVAGAARENIVQALTKATHILCTIPPSPQDTLVRPFPALLSLAPLLLPAETFCFVS